MGIKAGNLPTSTIDAADYLLITEGEAPKRALYSDVKNDMIGTETLETTSQTVKGAINENKAKIDLNTASLSENTQQISNLNTNKADKNSPTEYDIPYINSLASVTGYKNKYHKNQFNEVNVSGFFIKSGTSNDIASGITLFTLPLGYRPTNKMLFLAKGFTIENNHYLAEIIVNTDGSVVFTPHGVTNVVNGFFTINFLGGN